MNINGGVLDGVRRIPMKIRELIIDGGTPGAPLGFRIRGSLAAGPPVTGSWRAGDLVVDRRGFIWICTAAGTPGRWTLTPNVLYPSRDTTGATDTLIVQAALNNAASSGNPVVVLSAGSWYFNAPLVIPAGVRFTGTLADVNDIAVYGTILNTVNATWAQGGAPFAAGIILNTNSQADTFGLNCHFANSSGMDGITSNNASNVKLQDINIYNGPLNGITARGNTWRGLRVMVTQAVALGISANASDSDWIDCNASSSGTNGWSCNNSINSRLIGCRSEFNSGNGYSITGDNTATGGMSMIGCSTDGNAQSALNVSGTGNWPLLVSAPMFRRDGKNGTSPAINVAANCTMPVIVDGLSVFPGFYDDGSGTQSPVTGVTIGSGVTYVSVTNALIHAVTTPVSGTITNGRAIATRTGSWNGPSAITMVADTA